MKDFRGNKSLLPLVPESSAFEGSNPILLHILNHLPPGPKALVVHHKKEEVLRATHSFDLTYCEQTVLNGTGGALLAAKEFLENQDQEYGIITMGDVPFVRTETYYNLVKALEHFNLVVLGFSPVHKKQYGLLEMVGDRVQKIIEWKYWKNYSIQKKEHLQVCNSGIYAARVKDLMTFLPMLEKRPHVVLKKREGKEVEVEEFFITDLIEMMNQESLEIGCVMAGDENEVMGIDDFHALKKAQQIFKTMLR